MTLLFCPLFLDEEGRIERNLRWLRYYTAPKLKEALGFDKILMVDNASSPENLKIIQDLYPEVHIIKKTVRLTRISWDGYGMWYRAHAEAAKFALENNYNKIIHLDSDAYIISARMAEYLKSAQYGWITTWCSMYGFPEANIQVICGDYIKEMYLFHTETFLQFYPEVPAETKIPFTHVERLFTGDRYGENLLRQTDDMDYYTQCENSITIRYRG